MGSQTPVSGRPSELSRHGRVTNPLFVVVGQPLGVQETVELVDLQVGQLLEVQLEHLSSEGPAADDVVVFAGAECAMSLRVEEGNDEGGVAGEVLLQDLFEDPLCVQDLERRVVVASECEQRMVESDLDQSIACEDEGPRARAEPSEGPGDDRRERAVRAGGRAAAERDGPSMTKSS